MSSTDERLVSEWLTAQATPASPQVHEEVMRRVRSTAQRPSWSASLHVGVGRALQSMPRWTDARPGPGLAALLVLALILVALVALLGSSGRPAPPFGAVSNGRIAFDAGGRIFVVDDSGEVSPGPAADATDDRSPAFSPDGRRIAYWSQGNDRTSALVVEDSGGGGRITIPIGGVRINTGTPPAWSPDGTRIAYTGLSHTVARVFIVRLDGSGTDAILGEEIRAMRPAWSPDGGSIAFVGVPNYGDRAAGIYVVGADGSGMRRLATSTLPLSSTQGERLSWAPVPGRAQLLYHYGPDGQYDIAIYDLATDTERTISPDGGNEFWASWSPDGSRIAWYAGSLPADEVRVSDVGSGIAPAPWTSILRAPPRAQGEIDACAEAGARAGLFICSPPVWSPDGESLAALDGTRSSVLLLDAGGAAAPRRIAVPVGESDSLSWQRAP